MHLKLHFLACAVLSAVLWPFFGLSSLLVFLTGFFIDTDHLFWHFAKGTKSIRKIYAKTDGKYRGQIDIFHTIEFGTAIAVISWIFFPKYFIVLIAGLISHYAMDKLHTWKAYSILLWLIMRTERKDGD